MAKQMMEFHEAANIFPMEEETIDSLAEDIKAEGLHYAITVFEGKILDGRRRYTACLKANVMPRFDYLEKCPDPIKFVWSLNYHRRNLKDYQKGIVAGRAKDLRKRYEAEAKTAQAEGQKAGGKARHNQLPGNVSRKQTECRSRDALGRQFGISGRTAERGTKVVELGIDELQEAVWDGDVGLMEGERIAKIGKDTPEKEAKQKKALEEELNRRAESKQKGEKPQAPESDTDSADASKPNGQRKKALTAANDVIDYLSRSPLVRIGKSNPHRDEAYDKVIRWLRSTKKDN